MNPAILVTGGAGYVGSAVCKALHAAGYLPVTYDNLSRGHRWAVQWGPIEEGDLADRERLDAVLSRHNVSAVIHMAAFAYVGESVTEPELYHQNNVANSMTLLDAMRDCGLGAIVFSSSCVVYGEPVRTPIDETHGRSPVNPYGDTKKLVEDTLELRGKTDSLQWAALRYFNAAGASPEGEIGEDHNPETHLIPLAIDAAIGARGPIEVFGTDYPTPDGTAIRDYVHVADLADAHILALKYLIGGGPSDAFNLGTGNGHSVREVIAAVERATGSSDISRPGARRIGDPAMLVADASKAKSTLDWNPVSSDLETLVGTAVDWHAGRLGAGQSQLNAN